MITSQAKRLRRIIKMANAGNPGCVRPLLGSMGCPHIRTLKTEQGEFDVAVSEVYATPNGIKNLKTCGAIVNRVLKTKRGEYLCGIACY